MEITAAGAAGAAGLGVSGVLRDGGRGAHPSDRATNENERLAARSKGPVSMPVQEGVWIVL